MEVGFDKLRVDRGRFSKSLDAAIRKVLKAGMAAALKEMVSRVPVLTGTARGSLQVIGDFTDVAVPIAPVAVRKDRGPDVGKSLGSLVDSSTSMFPKFTFRSDVVWYMYNEFFNTHSPTSPWGSLEAGRKAFREYVRAHLKEETPKVKDFILRTRVGHGG